MTFVYTLLIIFVISFVCYRMINKKSTPSNRFTPYDDMTTGIKGNITHSEFPIHDTKHHIQYEEKADNEQTTLN